MLDLEQAQAELRAAVKAATDEDVVAAIANADPYWAAQEQAWNVLGMAGTIRRATWKRLTAAASAARHEALSASGAGFDEKFAHARRASSVERRAWKKLEEFWAKRDAWLKAANTAAVEGRS